MEEGKPRPMGGFIRLSPRDHDQDHQDQDQDIVEPPDRALSPPGCGLLEPYKDMPRRGRHGSGVLEPMAGFLDFNQFKQALDIESLRVSNSESSDSSEVKGSHNSQPIFFPVEVEFDKLFDWSKAVKQKQQIENNNNNNNNNNKSSSEENNNAASATGKLVNVNNTKVAVFRYGDQVLATSDKCPHAGGPIHLGDIEMLPDKSLCVRCPWHRWSFRVAGPGECQDQGVAGSLPSTSLESGGRGAPGECVFPRARKDKRLKVFPAKLDQTRNKIKIGFHSFDSKTLRDEEY